MTNETRACPCWRPGDDPCRCDAGNHVGDPAHRMPETKVYTVTITDREADASAAYVFESEADADAFYTGTIALLRERQCDWLTVGTVESPTLIAAGDAPALADVLAEWTMDQ